MKVANPDDFEFFHKLESEGGHFPILLPHTNSESTARVQGPSMTNIAKIEDKVQAASVTGLKEANKALDTVANDVGNTFETMVNLAKSVALKGEHAMTKEASVATPAQGLIPNLVPKASANETLPADPREAYVAEGMPPGVE